MATDTRRLTILSAEEIAALYDLSKFNDDDRRLYFDFSAVERDAVERIHTSLAAVQPPLRHGAVVLAVDARRHRSDEAERRADQHIGAAMAGFEQADAQRRIFRLAMTLPAEPPPTTM